MARRDLDRRKRLQWLTIVQQRLISAGNPIPALLRKSEAPWCPLLYGPVMILGKINACIATSPGEEEHVPHHCRVVASCCIRCRRFGPGRLSLRLAKSERRDLEDFDG